MRGTGPRAVSAVEFVVLACWLGVYALAIVGGLVLGGTALTWARDQHTTRMARVAAYAGGPLRPTHRHTRSTR